MPYITDDLTKDLNVMINMESTFLLNLFNREH